MERVMDASRTPRIERLAASFIVGAATGALLGLLTIVVPTVTIAVILLVMVMTAGAVVRRTDRVRAISLAGVVVGAGAFLAFGTINTVVACAQSETFCGDANVVPLAAFAITAIVGGLASALIVKRRSG